MPFGAELVTGVLNDRDALPLELVGGDELQPGV